MIEKRFYIAKSNLIDGYCVFDREKKYTFSPKPRKADCLNDAHILNELSDKNEQLKKENKFLRCTIESNNQDDYIDYLEKQNERLKERITELASNDKIIFTNG